MDTDVKLLENEKLLLDCQPQSGLVLYNVIGKNIIGRLIQIVILAGFAMYYWQSKNMSAKVHIDLTQFTDYKRIIVIAVCIVIAYLLICYLYNYVVVSRFRYVFTDQRCIVYSGFIGTNKRVIPFNRVADVNIYQNTAQALFGLSSVCIDEQAMNYQNTLILAGLTRDDAENATQIVSNHIIKKQA